MVVGIADMPYYTTKLVGRSDIRNE